MFKDKEFWIDTAYRCLWTAGECVLGCATIGQALTDIKWMHTLSITAVAVLICLVKQIAVYAKKHIKEEYDDNE